MEKWLDKNGILMYSTQNEGKSVIYQKMTSKTSEFYLPYLNKLVAQHNNTSQNHINANDFTLTEAIETSPNTHQFKVNDKVRMTKYENIFSKGYIDSVLKTNPWTYKFKDLNGEKII